jgi:[ribosomal protein S18]-alanine N-acetyltransferase
MVRAARKSARFYTVPQTGSPRMIVIPNISLATPADARPIAELSRDCIEHGLGWSWTPSRVLNAIRDRATNVAVATEHQRTLLGFGIMQYGDDHAHLSLLAVHPVQRKRGLGALLLDWLEKSAVVAGIERVRLEARADNDEALAFYEDRGYKQTGLVSGYYQGSIDAVRFEKRLRGGTAGD